MMSKLRRIIPTLLLSAAMLGVWAVGTIAEAQSRRFGGGWGYRGPGPAFGSSYRPYYRPFYRPYYRSYPGWAPFGIGLGLGLGLGMPWWFPPAYPYGGYPYGAYPYGANPYGGDPYGAYPYGAPPYPPATAYGFPPGGKPGEPWAGTPVSPWLSPTATASICRVGPMRCELALPMEPGTACSCPGGNRGEVWGRAQ